MSQSADDIARIKDICLLHSVRQLFAFGSVLTDRYIAESDIDLLIDFFPIDPSEYAGNYTT